MSDNIRPKGRCCDCRWLAVSVGWFADCEAPIPDVHQPKEIVRLTAEQLLAVRSCDCYEPRIKPLEEDNG